MNDVIVTRFLVVFSAIYASISAHSAAMPFERELSLPAEYTSHRVSQMMALEPGATATLMDEEGPGAITHIWMTVGKNAPRQVVLRMYWDGETEPSVEAPLPDFFGVGHNRLEPEKYFGTPCLAVAPKNGYNVYFAMPFRERARVTMTNEQATALSEGGGVYLQADYVRYASLADDVPYFHAQWRREAPAARRGKPYTVLEAVGQGFIAGVTHHVRIDDTSDRWFHGGGDTIFVDGTTAPTVLKGIGGEDFVGESWHSNTFQSPYAGCTSHRNGRVSLYRFFLESPPRFNESARFALGAMENEMTSVGYWYQTEPHRRFFRLPNPSQRDPDSTIVPGAYDETLLADEQMALAVIGPFAGDIDTEIPFDGMERIDLSQGVLTNYPLPYQNTIPDDENRAVTWQRTGTALAWLDLEAIYKPKMAGPRGVQALPGTVAYALLRLNCEEAMTRTLRVGYDDAVRVWVNGDRAGDFSGQDDFALGDVTLELRRGTNDVLLKISNTWNTNWAAFAVALALDDRDGVAVESFEGLERAP